MDRRGITLAAGLVLACALGFTLNTPPSIQAAGDGSAPRSGPTEDAAAAAPSIDTTPYWDNVEYINSFGMPNTATYGQTISMTESAELTQFSFYMAVTPTAVFRGLVYEWDGAKATGAALFESAPMSTTQGVAFEEVVFSIPCGVPLSAGKQYVLFASTSKDPAQPNSAGKWGSSATNAAYSGGQFVFLNNGSTPGQWTSTAWNTIAEDLAFKATIVRPASLDTTPAWDRAHFIGSFGMPNTATYGQTISMTEAAELTQFSFHVTVTPTAIFRGYVFEWDGTKAAGAPLFGSGPMNTRSVSCQEIVFAIPDGVALAKGKQYVLFASTSKDPAQPNSVGQWGTIVGNTAYGGGQFVFLNNGADSTKWTSTTWSTAGMDLAFKASLQWQVLLPLVIRE